jgi:signal transduction histidine kinase
VPLPEFLRTTTFRWTLTLSAAFAAFVLLMFAFVYWQTVALATAVADRLNADEASRLVSLAPGQVIEEIDVHLRIDPLHSKLTGLFDKDGNRLAGNIATLPHVPNDVASSASIARIDPQGLSEKVVRVIARRLADGRTVVVARDYEGLGNYGGTLSEALALGLVPAPFLALAAGTLLSLRAQRRVAEVTSKVQRIVAGELRERLPARSGNDPFDRLATLVNGMLDEIQRLVEDLAGVGNDIAHDLRTPLTRVRVGLERARLKAAGPLELNAAIDQAIVGLDQSLAIITALLRIAEIEHSNRLAGFRDVALADLVREVGDLYEPSAEDKRIEFVVSAKEDAIVHGDRDLLFEAIGNLVDNAVKFSPAGGRVELGLLSKGDDAVIRVSDTGPGIAAGEQDLVTRRFYRSDKSRSIPGLGLGLSLVNAIAGLHGFRFSIAPGPGCVAEIVAPRIGK